MTIQGYSNNSTSLQLRCNNPFKGKYVRSENGVPYYKTNKGLKAGAITTGLLETLVIAGALSDKKTNKTALALASIGLMLPLIGGLVYDAQRNKCAKQATNEVYQLGAEKALANNKKLKVSEKGNVYYESNDGVKYGAIAGVLNGIAEGTEAIINKENSTKFFKNWSKPAIFATCVAVNTLVFGLAGKALDYFTNKDAYKNS